jgi:RHS repeat-associated protein
LSTVSSIFSQILKLIPRTDFDAAVHTFTYDHANRLTGVSYTVPSGQGIAAMPNVSTTTPNSCSANTCYFYDQGGASAHAIGRMTGMADPTGSESYTYDAAGRTTQYSKVIGAQTYSIGYQYDASGNVKRIQYPSGRMVYQAYNSIGQLCQISPYATGCNTSGFYAGNYSYNAPGQMTGFLYGNGVAAQLGYWAPRGQLSSLRYTNGAQTYFSVDYSYKQNSQSCPNGATQNNGSIQCITDDVDNGRSVSYGYDALGRMISAQTNGSAAFSKWAIAESYDRYGNRLTQSVTAGSGPSANLSFSAKNQPTGYAFDSSGNMVVEPLSPPNNMTYDGENRMTAFSGNGGAASYTYDGNGLRVVKSLQGGTTTVSVFAGSSVLAEYDNGAVPGLPSREYIHGASGLLAMISGGATTYYHQDHLSVRLTTDANGNILSQDGHFPFGEQWYQSGANNKFVFTSYNRDSESGLDYALARYYDSRTGTFCSADPLAGSPGDPQSWNRYPYGRNDPIDKSDPNGKFAFLIPLIMEFLPQLVTDSAILASGAVETITVSATISAMPEVVGASIEGGLIASEALGQAALSPRDMTRFNEAQQKAQNNLKNKKCAGFLSDHGIDPTGVSKAIATEVPWDGVKSTISKVAAGVLDPQELPNLTPSVLDKLSRIPVSDSFKTWNGNHSYVGAVSQAGGHNVYFNPGGMIGNGGLTPGNVMHEGLHNLTGLGDPALASELGIQNGGSNDINVALHAHKCF